MKKQLKPLDQTLQERRKEGRIFEENKVKFRIASNPSQPQVSKTYYALSRDISVGGIRILTEKYLPVGTKLRMELALLDSDKLINVVGKVIWTNSLYDNELYETGVEFAGPSTKMIIDLIEHIYEKNH